MIVGKCMISLVLCILGLSEVKNFGKYYWVFNWSNWDVLKCLEILFRLLLGIFCLFKNFVVVLDEIIECCWGLKIFK